MSSNSHINKPPGSYGRASENSHQGNETDMGAAAEQEIGAQGYKPEMPGISLDTALSSLGTGKFQYKMILLAGGGYFAVCSDLLVLAYLSEPLTTEWDLGKYTFPWLPFCGGIASVIGCFVFGSLSDKFGRMRPFIAAVGISAIFGLASCFSPAFWVYILLRAFVSFANSGLAAVDFVLLLEFLPSNHRGPCMIAITFCGALGALLAGGLAWWLLPSYGWRVFVGACTVPSFLVFGGRLLWTHESPRYLFVSGQEDKAIAVLRKIAEQNNTQLPEDAFYESLPIAYESTQDRGRISALFSPELRGRTFFYTLVWLFQSMGYWGLTLYMPSYISSLGINPYFNMFTLFIADLPGLCLAMVLIQTNMLGRVKCLRVFSSMTILTLILFAIFKQDFLKAVLVMVVYFFMVPIYSILNTYTPESYPTDTRGVAMAWVNVVIAVPGLITPFVGETLLGSSIEWLYPVAWCGIFFLQFLSTLGLQRETAGHSLQDIK